MDDSKKRKREESMNNNNINDTELESFNLEQQLRLLLDPLQKNQLIDLLAKLGTQHPAVAEEIRGIASADPVHRKLFVRGLAWETTSETLCAAFCEHGEIEEGAVIVDKASGKSRGYGFITYKHMESTQRALRQPSKLIDGRLAVCNLARESLSSVPVSSDIAQRKLYIGGLSPETSNETFLVFFSRHGKIEEGSITYDKETKRSRGFGFVTYQTIEAAKRAIDAPDNTLGGRDLTVKYADSRNKAAAQGQRLLATTLIPVPVPPGYTLPSQIQAGSVDYPAPAAYPAYHIPAQEQHHSNNYLGAAKDRVGFPSAQPSRYGGYSYGYPQQ